MIKVLVIDDDTFLLEMYANKFKAKGYDVMTVKNAADALKTLEEKQFIPDILVIDIFMPDKDGIEMLKEIKAKKLAEKATYVILSNQSQPEGIAAAKAVGIHGYIIKATAIPSEVVDQVGNIHASRS